MCAIVFAFQFAENLIDDKYLSSASRTIHTLPNRREYIGRIMADPRVQNRTGVETK